MTCNSFICTIESEHIRLPFLKILQIVYPKNSVNNAKAHYRKIAVYSYNNNVTATSDI